ncbi:alpha/beta hydrolase [Halomonas campaniensis]|nr:alpha/beta hydrolase [Halomonas campaniensis]
MDYFQEGTGEYLVLVHGALTDGAMWLPHIEYLKGDYEVVSVTLRHFGKPCSGGFGLNTHANDLAELLSSLAKDKPINIVGWSYGADVIINMLVTHDLALSNVFLYEPGYPGCLQGEKMDAWQSDANAMFSPVFENFHAGNMQLAVEHLIDGSGNRKGYFSTQDESIQALQISKAYTLTHQLNQQEQPAINAELVSKISAPIVIGYGAETRDMFRLVAQQTAHLLANSVINEVVGEGHMLPQESPEKFSTHIKLALGHGL